MERHKPFADQVFGQDSDEPLQRSSDSSVDLQRHERSTLGTRTIRQGVRRKTDHNGSSLLRELSSSTSRVLELELFRQLEIQLDRRHLVLSLERVRTRDINLGTVELDPIAQNPSCLD